MSAVVKPIAPQPLDGDEWLSLLTRTKQGGIVGHEDNVLTALRHAPDVKGLVRYNRFSLSVEVARKPPWRSAEIGEPWRDEDETECAAHFQKVYKFPALKKGLVLDCVAAVAHDAEYHPVTNYLGALKWDKTRRLNTWLSRYLGASGNEDYLAAIGRCWPISAVARVFEPGCKADHVLTLEGPQGIMKSSACATLAGAAEWFTDSLPDIHSKDAAIQLCGRWIAELAELAAIRRSDSLESMKSFLTRTHDVYRPPYGRRAVSVPRQNVFIATTNEQTYLRDHTGNRRFWPVKCSRIDIAALRRDRDQLLAEAVVAYRAGEQWHLTKEQQLLAQQEQEARVYISELEYEVAEYCEKEREKGKTEVTTYDIFKNVLKLYDDEYAAQRHEIERRMGPKVAAALQRAGYYQANIVGKGKARRNIYAYQEPEKTRSRPRRTPHAADKRRRKARAS